MPILVKMALWYSMKVRHALMASSKLQNNAMPSCPMRRVSGATCLQAARDVALGDVDKNSCNKDLVIT